MPNKEIPSDRLLRLIEREREIMGELLETEKQARKQDVEALQARIDELEKDLAMYKEMEGQGNL